MKLGDLVTVAGACYDAPINHHDAGAAIRHYVGIIEEGSLGVLLGVTKVFYAARTYTDWYQVLTGGRAVWLNTLSARSVCDEG